MMAIPTPALPNHQDVQREAIHVLVDRLGTTKTAIFLGENRWQPTDYLQIKQQLFAGETVDSLYAKILDWRSAIATPENYTG